MRRNVTRGTAGGLDIFVMHRKVENPNHDELTC